ncbi:MAG: DUF1349 domain-containing protein [Chloroflexi bacterium]|nr:DUF1349 domain-containing protein [Chloroflexota bacterium]
MKWYNEPPSWEEKDGAIIVHSAPTTDFWRKTHYGFIRDTGHFYGQPISGDFVAEVKITGEYRTLYDQAGLMVRLDEVCWLKCGIEYVGGVQHVSAVVTRDFSDWCIIPLPQHPPALWMRVTRRGEAVEIHYSLDGVVYTMLRLAHFCLAEQVQVGIMSASPEGNGFKATFTGFDVREL